LEEQGQRCTWSLPLAAKKRIKTNYGFERRQVGKDIHKLGEALSAATDVKVAVAVATSATKKNWRAAPRGGVNFH
jgi:hypothetical protein